MSLTLGLSSRKVPDDVSEPGSASSSAASASAASSSAISMTRIPIDPLIAIAGVSTLQDSGQLAAASRGVREAVVIRNLQSFGTAAIGPPAFRVFQLGPGGELSQRFAHPRASCEYAPVSLRQLKELSDMRVMKVSSDQSHLLIGALGSLLYSARIECPLNYFFGIHCHSIDNDDSQYSVSLKLNTRTHLMLLSITVDREPRNPNLEELVGPGDSRTWRFRELGEKLVYETWGQLVNDDATARTFKWLNTAVVGEILARQLVKEWFPLSENCVYRYTLQPLGNHLHQDAALMAESLSMGHDDREVFHSYRCVVAYV